MESAKINKIEDFGEKIGGAKKDLWRERGLEINDLIDMNDAEKLKFITKDNIWKKPNYEEMVENGLPVRVAYFIKIIRDATPVKPEFIGIDKDKVIERQEGYVEFVSNLRNHMMNIRTEIDVADFYNSYMQKYITRNPNSRYITILPNAHGCITNKLLQVAQVRSFYEIDSNIKKKQFCYTKEQKILSEFDFYEYDEKNIEITKYYKDRTQMSIKYSFGTTFIYPSNEFADPKGWENKTIFVIKRGSIIARNIKDIETAKGFIVDKYKDGVDKQKTGKKRKKAFIPKQLEQINRTGEDYRTGKNIQGQDMLNTFEFRGGEFGNWLNENDKQQSLNYGYDAFMDLSKVLEIEPTDVSFGHRLAIAFGARGSGTALAHYEPTREVINLTKMKGAGSLAHEWAHALDDIVGKQLGLNDFMTKHIRDPKTPSSISKLVESMKYKQDGAMTKTEFYKNSIKFDEINSKTDNGYYQDTTEMFARAFACYISDKLEGESDYLCGHADLAVDFFPDKNDELQIIKAFPEGEERILINNCFDEVIQELKEKNILNNLEVVATKNNEDYADYDY